MAPWISELTPLPRRIVPAAETEDGGQFAAGVRRYYLRMQEALARSDLTAFGHAFDSLGLLLRNPPR